MTTCTVANRSPRQKPHLYDDPKRFSWGTKKKKKKRRKKEEEEEEEGEEGEEEGEEEKEEEEEEEEGYEEEEEEYCPHYLMRNQKENTMATKPNNKTPVSKCYSCHCCGLTQSKASLDAVHLEQKTHTHTHTHAHDAYEGQSDEQSGEHDSSLSVRYPHWSRRPQLTAHVRFLSRGLSENKGGHYGVLSPATPAVSHVRQAAW